MNKLQYDELKEFIPKLEIMYKAYYKETRDLMSRLIVLENNLTRLNHLLMMIRKNLAERNGKKE